MWLDSQKESSSVNPASNSEEKKADSSTPLSVLTVAEAASSTPEKGTSSSDSVLEAHLQTKTVSPLDRLTSVIQVEDSIILFKKLVA